MFCIPDDIKFFTSATYQSTLQNWTNFNPRSSPLYVTAAENVKLLLFVSRTISPIGIPPTFWLTSLFPMRKNPPRDLGRESREEAGMSPWNTRTSRSYMRYVTLIEHYIVLFQMERLMYLSWMSLAVTFSKGATWIEMPFCCLADVISPRWKSVFQPWIRLF